MFIKITDKPINPEEIINLARNPESGCVVTYVGLIRRTSRGKPVLSVEYKDTEGQAENKLKGMAADIKSRFPVNDLAMCHRTGKLNVGEINLVFAFACSHRQDGFAACQYAIDRFKETLPTSKIETYADDTNRSQE